MAGSVFGYATLANVEAFTGIDYSVVDATAFSDSNVEYKISMAEYMINAHYGTSTAQTVTNGITMATIMITAILLDENMRHLGYHEEAEHSIGDVLGMDIHMIITHYLVETEDGFVDSIPMSGANYHKSDIRY